MDMKKFTIKDIDMVVRQVTRGEIALTEEHAFVLPMKLRLEKFYPTMNLSEVVNHIIKSCEQYDINYSLDIYDALEEMDMVA